MKASLWGPMVLDGWQSVQAFGASLLMPWRTLVLTPNGDWLRVKPQRLAPRVR